MPRTRGSVSEPSDAVRRRSNRRLAAMLGVAAFSLYLAMILLKGS